MHRITLLSLLLFLFGSTGAQDQTGTTIFLIRHGETVSNPDTRDPALNMAGLERAALLAQMLRSSAVQAIYSTDYQRTQQTVQPLAAQTGLPIQSYNPRALADFAESLKKLRGSIVVAGHSNTTPQLVQLLGGDPGPALDHTYEFDRLYTVTILPDGQVSSTLLRYGNPGSPPKVDRKLVVTIDDLPINSLVKTNTRWQQITQNLLNSLTAAQVPAIGFVNEQKLHPDGELDPGRRAMLKDWADAGLELGNHTWSHPDYHRISFQEFSEDILKGEVHTRALMEAKGKQLRYFRHPFLHTGNTPEKKAKLEAFLKEQGYTIAPVTIDNSEWIFARAYEKALLAKDTGLQDSIGRSYIRYMDAKTAFFEQQSRLLFDREIPQVLLIHANALNGDYLDELLAMYQKRGYSFTTLEEALQDEAYQSADDYTGMGGITWLHRWALTKEVDKMFFRGEPRCPEFVQEVAGIRE